MSGLPRIHSIKDIRMNEDPYLDAWVLHFMTENNLEHLLNPLYNASPEQLRFMAVLEEDQVFVPCSDEMFGLLIKDAMPEQLQDAYNTVWRRYARLVREHMGPSYLRSRILQFSRHRYRLALASHILIPSRLTKRLVSIFLTQSGIEDPYARQKQQCNAKADEFIKDPKLDAYLNACPESQFACERIADLRSRLNLLEFQRLLYLSAWADLQFFDRSLPRFESLIHSGEDAKEEINRVRYLFEPERYGRKKILYLPNNSGGLLFDLKIIESLLRLGHNVILALKAGSHYLYPNIWDMENDPILARDLEHCHFIGEGNLSKNDLLDSLRRNQFVAVTDGTAENLNLYRVSVTFARAWKEADLIIAKGEPNARRLIKTANMFTRDILSFYMDRAGRYHLEFKPRPAHVKKFSEAGIKAMADRIIQTMREAKQSGRSIMFYSAIIGSIPGQTKTAVEVVGTFVNYLRSRMEGSFIINPAEHFEEGMDGDDLMYMWERVQRSGLLDVWRFQTVSDIEKSFEIMGRKVPPIWTGKDATFSTGCTKEMNIALSMQEHQPELQIIGPSRDSFFRRREYGVGKYFDAGIEYR